MTKSKRNSHCLLISDLIQRTFFRCLFFSAVWFVLTGSEVESWILGAPAVFLAVALSISISPSWNWTLNPVGVCSFIPFFLGQSTLSGIDVMRRSLSPRLLINPGLVLYTTMLPEGSFRVFFVNTISLLPGTLSADLQGDTVTIHTLDIDLPIWANIQNLEGRVALLFRLDRAKRRNL